MKGLPEETIFLAQMGLIRWLEGAGENGWPADTIKIRNGRVLHVIPKYPHPNYRLPEAEEEEVFLKNVFDAKQALPESGEIRKLIKKPGEFDLLHFACHGVAESGNINEAKLLMQGRIENGEYIIDPFSATSAKFSNLKSNDNAPMVVLNACQAGRAGYKLTGIGGFANYFLLGGAGAFVGTLWSVGDSPARTFTETLYKVLDQGKNLSEATIEARNAARAAGESTWLAYVVYGHPHLKIKRS
jgi:CHAT domain-containing protein